MTGLYGCARAIQEAAPSLSADDVEEVLSAIVRRERGMPNRKGDLLRWQEAARAASAEELERAAIEKRSRQINALRRAQRQARYDAALAAGRDMRQVMSDMLTTSARAGEGRALSVEAMQVSARDNLTGAFLADLEKAGGLPLLRHLDPQTEEALTREVARLNGAPGVAAATDQRIKDVALVIAKHNERVRTELNAAGAWIAKTPGYVARTQHDSARINRAGFEGWRDAILPLLDERTFRDAGVDMADPEDVTKFLRNVWSNLASGNHHVAAPGDKADPLTAFKGPGNLARRLSEDRVLHFRGPDEWLAYNRQFGGQNLVGAIMSRLDHAARSLGLMKVFGTNPEAAFRDDLQRIADGLRDAGKVEEARALLEAGGDRASLSRQWRVVSGEAMRPGNHTAATIMGSVHVLETMARLGGVTLSAIPDVPVTAAALRHEGIPYWAHIGRAVSALFEGTPKGVRGEVALRLRAGVNGLIGGIYSRMGPNEAVPGALARATDLFFKLNLQTWWTDSMERAIAFSLSSHVAGNLSRAWPDMDAGLRAGLARYGITEADWNAARGAALLEADGVRYFTPDMVADAGARDRFAAWFATTMEGAMTKPGAYERSILTGGEAPGTAFGEAMRLLTKFKSYPLTFITRHWTREVDRAGSIPQAIANVGGLMAATTLLGYVSMTLKDLAKGRNPREPEDAAGWAKVVGAAMLQGGSLGIMGDFLFAEYNRFGGGLASTLAGPTIGSVEQFMRTWARAIRGDDPTANAIGLLRNEVLTRAVPFVPGGVVLNTFYGRLAVDHLFVHHLQEAVNPGYLDRYQRRVERENHQTFWLEPGALAR